MRLADLVRASALVAGTRSRLEKVGALADLLRALPADEVAIGVAYLCGETRQGRIGVGYATLRDVGRDAAAEHGTLTLREVDLALEGIAEVAGRGAVAERARRLERLLAGATREEQGFLRRLLLGELRQGALAGSMVEAIARAAGVSARRVRRAHMLCGDLADVARAALAERDAGLDAYRLVLFRPVRPMLAQSAQDPPAALERLGRAALEFKLDGARVQVHRDGDRVAVYTRQLNEVTAAVPELVEAARGLRVRRLVLDGEVLALQPDGRPHPFQTSMRRFGRRRNVESLRAELPLQPYFFDCLHLDGQDLIDLPMHERWSALCHATAASGGEALRIPRIVTDAPERAEAFSRDALDRGHEGLVAKALDAPYAAGARGASWLKVKPARSLDLVVLAAEWGSGRRRGRLSNLHLGARDPRSGGFVMLGKTFKGLTDAMLDWQTERLQALALGSEGHVVHVAPVQVVEVAFDGLQESRHYPGGLALRFARVRRYRQDKRAEEADTIDTVRALHAAGRRSD